jgi:hypothetical protein
LHVLVQNRKGYFEALGRQREGKRKMTTYPKAVKPGKKVAGARKLEKKQSLMSVKPMMVVK